MELDDLKTKLEAYDSKLSENLSINERLLETIISTRTHKEMSSVKRFQLSGLVLVLILLLLFIIWTISFAGEPLYLISGLASICLIISLMPLAFRQIKMLSQLGDYYGPVVERQQKLAGIRKLYLRNKKISLMIMPLMLVAFLPITAKGLTGVDYFSLPPSYTVPSIVVALIIAYALGFLILKSAYEDKFKSLKAFLDRMADFEREE